MSASISAPNGSISTAFPQKKALRLANPPAGHNKVIAILPPGPHVILEAISAYEQALWLAMLRAGKTVSKLKPQPDILPSDWEFELSSLIGRRGQRVTARAIQKTQLLQLSHPQIITQAKAPIKALSREIAQLDKLIKTALNHQDARQKAGRLQQMKGIAEVAAATLMAELPGVGSLDDSRVASLRQRADARPAPHPGRAQKAAPFSRWARSAA